jgi:GMP synthase (glutamine-hydrolysing)
MAAPSRVAVVLRHERMAHLGNLEPVLLGAGFDVRYVDVAEGADLPSDAAAADLLVVLGASAGVYEVERYPFISGELAFVRSRLDAKRPTLGVCFGSQVMAAALGAQVSPGETVQVGFRPVEPTDAGALTAMRHFAGVPVLQWHGDTFTLPEGATRLAGSSDYANEAFGIEDWAMAVQFHPEITADMHEEWLDSDQEYVMNAGYDPAELRDDFDRLGLGMRHAAESFLTEWLRGLPLS